MSEQETEGTARAWHLKRADEETGRADGAVESTVRRAHLGLAKLHRDRAGGNVPPELLIVRE
jgi:hypothetical protein